MASESLAILNGFGRSLGDSLIGLQALRIAQTMGAMPVPLLVRRHYGRALVDQLYAHAADFTQVLIRTDLEADDAPPGFKRVIDMRDFVFDSKFRGASMIDFFLARLGLDPSAVPARNKRNSWLMPRIRPLRPAGLPASYMLVCPGSSMPLRDMPSAVHAAVLQRLRALGTSVVTQGTSSLEGVMALPSFTQLEDLCGLVAGASAIVSTDTAMVHLADAFDVPCLAVFTTHRPHWRVRDYPLCTPVHLPLTGFPDALEFARDDRDIDAATNAWLGGIAEILEAMETLVTRAGSPRHQACSNADPH